LNRNRPGSPEAWSLNRRGGDHPTVLISFFDKFYILPADGRLPRADQGPDVIGLSPPALRTVFFDCVAEVLTEKNYWYKIDLH
jgi:hypothetical protein